MSLLPTTREASPSPTAEDRTESSASTRVVAPGGTKTPSENSETRSGEYSEKGYEDKGLIEVEEDGQKRTMRVVLEQKSGKEVLKEVAGGTYTTPQWCVRFLNRDRSVTDDDRRHSLPFINPKHPPPPAPVSLDSAAMTPEITASWFSFLFFNWISPLMALGSARPLQATDLWRMDADRSAGKLSDDLIKYFEKRQVKAKEYNERLADPSTPLPFSQRVRLAFGGKRAERENEYRTKTGKKEASLAWALSDTFGMYFWLAGPIKVVGDLASAFTPLLIRAIIKWTTRWQAARDRGLPEPSTGEAAGLAIGLFLLLVTASLTIHHFFLRECIFFMTSDR